MPSSAELFWPAAGRVSLALAGGLGAIVLAERRHLRDLGRRVLFVRWRTWLVTAPIYGAAVMWSRWFALAFVGALALQGMREYATLTGLPRPYRLMLVGAGLASLPLALLAPGAWFAVPSLLLVGATILPVVVGDTRDGLRHLAYGALGFAYVPWLLGHFLVLRERPDAGPGLLLGLGTAVAASDVFAFIAGKAFGRRRLAPRVSPAKTWEGLVGNLAGAYLGFALMGFALPAGMPAALRWTLPAVVAVGCVWGDLVESLVKRCSGVKDSGSWLPGFGGLLDRIDSLLVVLPLVSGAIALWA